MVAISWIVGCSGDQAEQVRSPSETGTVAACGDGILDDGEACDDGNTWRGDGCSDTCFVEEGDFEVEPNDASEDATAVAPPLTILGNLPAADRDCFSFEVPQASALVATMRQDPQSDSCAVEAVIEALDADGVRITAGLPDLATGCPAIDPDRDTFARYLSAGEVTVCVEPAFDGQVPWYALDLDVVDACTGLAVIPLDRGQDLDGDDIADVCDDDDDGDGVLDEVDNCPTVPNGPTAPFGWDTADEGFVRLWMILGPFTTGVSPVNCEPSPDAFTGPSDPESAPVLGEVVGTAAWFAEVSWPADSAIVDFNTWFAATPAPREAYAAAWLYTPVDRDVVVAFGSDDGFRAWIDDTEIGSVSGCQGVGVDAFPQPATALTAGWHRLLVKVYDGGGGWGLVARLYEADGTTPVTDVDVSLAGPMLWADNQTDADSDGIGDVCETP